MSNAIATTYIALYSPDILNVVDISLNPISIANAK